MAKAAAPGGEEENLYDVLIYCFHENVYGHYLGFLGEIAATGEWASPDVFALSYRDELSVGRRQGYRSHAFAIPGYAESSSSSDSPVA
jgi:hypothetical protein